MGGFQPHQKSERGGRPPGKINASLDEKLRNVKWGEYRIGDLFEIESTLSFNSDKLVPGSDYDYITRTSLNQGIFQTTGFVNRDNINPAGTWSLGLMQMDFFYRRKPWYAGQFVRKIIPKISIKEPSVLFFTTLLNKQRSKLLSVLVRDIDEVFRSIRISLPTKNGGIDFDFIESFVTELEAEHIAELSAYLKVNGLDDCILSEEEEKAVENMNAHNIEWGEYKLEELFHVQKYKKRFDANKVTVFETGKHPYIVRMSGNNGQKGFINEDEKYLNEGNTLSFGQDTATVFYQEKPFFTGDKIKILKCKNERFGKQNALFFVATITKAFESFSWGSSSYSVDTIGNQPIKLPAKNGEIDFDCMELLISAIQKLEIRDVVRYADKRAAQMKNLPFNR